VTTTFDASKKSPGIGLSGGGLVAAGPSSGYGCVLSTNGIASGAGYFVVTATTVPGEATMWVGVANASHHLTDSGQSWAGGDADGAGLYDTGVLWTPSQVVLGPSYTFASGDTIRVDIDRAAGTFTLSVNGVVTPAAYALPSGTIYAAVGLDNPGSLATADFSGMDGGGSTIAVSGTAVGAGAASAQSSFLRSLQGAAGGAVTAAASTSFTLILQGSGAGIGVASGGWAAAGVLLLVGASEGSAPAIAVGAFPGGERWVPAVRSPEQWTAATISPQTWQREPAVPETWIRSSEAPGHG